MWKRWSFSTVSFWYKGSQSFCSTGINFQGSLTVPRIYIQCSKRLPCEAREESTSRVMQELGGTMICPDTAQDSAVTRCNPAGQIRGHWGEPEWCHSLRNPLLRNLLLKGKLFLGSGDATKVTLFFSPCTCMGEGGVPEALQETRHPPGTSRVNGWLPDRRRQNNCQNFFQQLSVFSPLWYSFMVLFCIIYLLWSNEFFFPTC